MSGSTRMGGATRIEVAVLMVAGLWCAAAVVGGIACIRGPSRRPQCASNIRQLGLGLESYNTDYQALPSAHRNVWWLIGGYLEISVPLNVSDPAARAPDYFRCPDDSMSTDRRNGCSYAPNYEAVDPFKAESGAGVADNGDARNEAFSPWSNCKLTSDENETPVVSRFLSVRSISQSGPSTILLIENWDPRNRAYFHNPPGLTGQAPFVEEGEITCPRPALEDYHGPAAGTGKSPDWVLDPQAENQHGAFLSLRSFARDAGARGRAISLDHDVYHSGRINVLFADQRVESLGCSVVFAKPPIAIDAAGQVKVRNPIWTRAEA